MMRISSVRATSRSYAICVLALCMAPNPIAAQYAPDPDSGAIRTKLRPAAQFLADIGDRPRRVIYTPYPVSPTRGIVSGFVHVGDGSAVPSRTDMVVDAPLPIVVRRAYHSSRPSSASFGATGWHLTIEELIKRRNSHGFSYSYGNGNIVDFDSKGNFRSIVEAYFSDVEAVKVDEAAIEVRMRTGVTKRFKRHGDVYRLAMASDEYGNKLDFKYSGGGMLKRVDGPSGAWVAFNRDKVGRITDAKDSRGRIVRYRYDQAGRLMEVSDVGEHVWQYSYDTENRLTATTTPNNTVDTEFEYDAQGRVKKSRANGMRLQFEYSGTETTVKDSRGLAATYRSAPSGITVAVNSALGVTTELVLAQNGLPKGLIRNGQQIVTFSYEREENLFPSHAEYRPTPDGQVFRVNYDARGLVASATSKAGDSLFVVDRYTRGLVAERVVYPDGSQDEAQFDAKGELARFAR